MKVCVIGASGQVGRPLMDELLKLGHEVRAVTRSSNSQYEAMQQRGVDVRVIDITSEQETTDAFQSCDVVISVVRADSETIEKLQPILRDYQPTQNLQARPISKFVSIIKQICT